MKILESLRQKLGKPKEMTFPTDIQNLVERCKQEGVTFREGSERRGWMYIGNIIAEEEKEILNGNIPERTRNKSFMYALFSGNPISIQFPLDDKGNVMLRKGEYKDKSALFIYHRRHGPVWL